MAASVSQDPLDLIRSAIKDASSQTDLLASIQLFDSQNVPTPSILQASTVKLGDVSLDKSTTTRLARSRDELASRISSGNVPQPDTEPTFFYNVEAVILALQAREERPGAYLAQAATAKVASFPTLDRAAILDYLLGRRSDWAGVLKISDLSASAAPGAPTTTAASAGDAAASGTQGVKRPYKVNANDVEYVKRIRSQYEVVLRTRNDALRGNIAALAGGAAVSRVAGAKVADFESFRRAFSAKVEAARRAQGKAGPGGAHAGSAAAASARSGGVSASGQVRKQRAQDPIVVLSSSPTSLLNMFNIKQFLEEGIFVPPEEARQKARGVADLVVSIISRGGGTAGQPGAGVGIGRRILVVDSAEAVTRLGGSSASAPGADPWNRVIAVFTTGQAWQFKTYKWSDPRELFKNVMGAYARWHNEPANPNVKDWNVLELVVDRSKRHTDKQVVSLFWRQLESWTQRRKPHLIA